MINRDYKIYSKYIKIVTKYKNFDGLSQISTIKTVQLFFTETDVYFFKTLLNYKNLHKIKSHNCNALSIKRLVITSIIIANENRSQLITIELFSTEDVLEKLNLIL